MARLRIFQASVDQHSMFYYSRESVFVPEKKEKKGMRFCVQLKIVLA